MLTQKELKTVILSQQQVLQKKLKHYIPRDIEQYIVQQNKQNDFVVVLKGIRRSGKSTLLAKLAHDHFKSNYYINFDDDRLIHFTAEHFSLLLKTFIQLYGKSKYIFLDEIQEIPGWERFVNRLKEQGYKVFVTGSNAKLLSKEFGTYLTGRYISYTIYPFSFNEFLKFHNINIQKKHLQQEKITLENEVLLLKFFNKYLAFGGFPEYLYTQNVQIFKDLYESILYKDIIARYHLTAENVIKQLGYIAASNIGKFISYRKYVGLGVKSSTTIKQYFEYFANVFLIFMLPKFSFSAKEQVLSRKKIYFIDNALARYIGYRPSADTGRFLENTIFLHLQHKLDTNVFYYANYINRHSKYFKHIQKIETNSNQNQTIKQKEKFECDFVVFTHGTTHNTIDLIQVTANLTQENTMREILGLEQTLSFLEQHQHIVTNLYIVTLDQWNDIKLGKRKIKVRPAWYFLLVY